MKKKILKFIRNLLLFFFGSSILAVIVLRFIPVYFTPLMFIRTTQQIIHGEDIKWKHSWIPKENISPHLPMAVIASEDNRFAEHNGFDFKEIEKALKENKNRKRPRGASTISQQTAKNIFLWPASSCIIRKSKFPQNPKRSVRFSGKRTKRSVQKRKARNTQKAETKVL